MGLTPQCTGVCVPPVHLGMCNPYALGLLYPPCTGARAPPCPMHKGTRIPHAPGHMHLLMHHGSCSPIFDNKANKQPHF